MKNIVVLGGGSGLSIILKGIKDIPDINLSAIVTVADDGGSTATMRREFNIPAVGDLRRVIVSLSSSEHILKDLMEYRFKAKCSKNSVFDKHSLGNLILSALIDINGSFYDGIQSISDILKVKGSIYPIANDPNLKIQAIYDDGIIVTGEHKIPNPKKRIKKIRYTQKKKILTNPIAINKIKEADYIVLSVGSLFTSIIPNLIAPGIKDAIIKNEKAVVIYIANIMTQNGETHDMTLYEHIKTIEEHLEYGVIDKVVAHQGKIPDAIIKKYAKEKSYPVIIDEKLLRSHVDLILVPLLNNSETKYLRHDAKKIQKTLEKIFNKQERIN